MLLEAAAIATALASVANTGLSFWQNDYNRDLQSRMFDREDTSIARRVADLKAAGLSPVLAAGQGANSGPIVQTRQPEVDTNFIPQIVSLLTMQKDFAVKDKQIEVLQSQKHLNDISTAMKSWDLSKYMQANTASNATGLAKTIRDLFQLSGSPIAERIKTEINEKINPSKIKIPGDKSGKTYNITPEDRAKAADEVKRIRAKLGL